MEPTKDHLVRSIAQRLLPYLSNEDLHQPSPLCAYQTMYYFLSLLLVYSFKVVYHNLLISQGEFSVSKNEYVSELPPEIDTL